MPASAVFTEIRTVCAQAAELVAAQAANMQRVMHDYPTPNLTVGAQVRRENMIIRICDDMAWASFDQYTPRTDDILITVGLSYQVRVFEKQDGRWKVAFAGHGDTSMEYFSSPAIHVDANRNIQWANDVAKNSLKVHPILMQSSGRLRTRNAAHDRVLQDAIMQAADLTVLDIRASVLEAQGGHASAALVFDDPLNDAFHIIWVTRSDGMIVVTYDDDDALHQRLDTAKTLYGMSKAQVRLAGYIVDGLDMQQAADSIGISVNTARTHLQRMFDKTKVHSQTALVRVLLSAQAPMP